MFSPHWLVFTIPPEAVRMRKWKVIGPIPLMIVCAGRRRCFSHECSWHRADSHAPRRWYGLPRLESDPASGGRGRARQTRVIHGTIPSSLFRHPDVGFQGPNQDGRLGPILAQGSGGEPIVEIPRNVLIDTPKRLPYVGHVTHPPKR